jgi:hypothetical protein
MIRTLSLVSVLLSGLAGCESKERAATSSNSVGAAAQVVLPAAVADANTKIVARQKAVKGWRSVAVPNASAGPCRDAPRQPDLSVNGFRTGTSAASKTMSIVAASELAGAPDPSLPPDVAADLAKVNAAGRGDWPLGWSELDYTTDEYPFNAGPIAKAYQFEVRKLQMRESTKDPKQLISMLSGNELVLVVDKQTRPEVHHDSQTFTPGTMSGVALLWSWDSGSVVCSGRYEASNESKSFEASKDQVGALPEEELELLALRAGASSLRALGK